MRKGNYHPDRDLRTVPQSAGVSKTLVIAPLRVARDTWPEEIQKWDHLKGLTYSVAVGTATERRAALLQGRPSHHQPGECAVAREESGLPFNYDMVVIDELSSFKSYQAKRFRKLMKARPRYSASSGSGTHPATAMDLWAEFRLLDMGKRLGRFITHYRDEFFLPDKRSAQQVFTYKPKQGAEREIYRRIGDITISMKSADYLKMPKCVLNEARAENMSDSEAALYKAMKDDLVVTLKGEIDAANAAALSGKLAYLDGQRRDLRRRQTYPVDSRAQAGRAGRPDRGRERQACVIGLLVQAWPIAESGSYKQHIHSPDWTRRNPSCGGTVVNCVALIHPASAGHGLNFAGGRLDVDLVWADMVAGTVSADQCPALAAGAASGNRGHPSHHHKGHD